MVEEVEVAVVVQEGIIKTINRDKYVTTKKDKVQKTTEGSHER
jgi:hypothetical protein